MSGKKGSYTASLWFLAIIIVIPAIFFASSFLGDKLLSLSPIVAVCVIAVVASIYTSYVSGLLWSFLEYDAPIVRFVPCFGELTLMETKYMTAGTVFYIIAAIFFGLTFLPYSVLSFLGTEMAMNMPFIFMVIAFISLGAVQIIKGIGIMNCTSNIAEIWEDKIGSDAGFIKRFGFLGFIPFVRVLSIYALSKPLSTMVTFMGETISDDSDVDLLEEEE